MLEDLKIAPEYDGLLFLAEAVRNPPVLRPHHHVELEFNLVAEGSITYVIDGRRMTFRKRELVWFFPQQEHQLVDRSANAAYYVAVFKPDLIRRTCRGERYQELTRSSPTAGEVVQTELTPPDFARLQQVMDALLADGLDADTLNRQAGFGLSADFSFRHHDADWLNAGLGHLLLLGWRLQQGHRGHRMPVVLHPAVCKALQRINNEELLEENAVGLARYCGVSAPYLSRIFHQQVGVTLTHYRNSVRLGRFWECYRANGRSNLLEAALAAGFGSYPQFFRVFAQAYGQGPRELLQEQS